MFVHHDGYDVFYETFGDAAHTPLLLINGFTSQSVSWPDALRDALVAAEFFVITFDNRDVGLSTKSAPGQHYLLSDMASDAVAVLDALDVSAPVVWGTSMGGMIAQTLTIDHPSRVAALCSVMSTTGNQEVGRPTSEALEALMTPPPEDREGGRCRRAERRGGFQARSPGPVSRVVVDRDVAPADEGLDRDVVRPTSER